MAKKNEILYVRNGRPNMLILRFNGMRHALEHRGNRNDSFALPAEAASDPDISRWLRDGTLEKISEESFMTLGKRRIDVLPNEYLRRDVRAARRIDVNMQPAEGDTTRTKTQVVDGDVHKIVQDNLKAKWSGDLMSTEEELETLDLSSDQESYPSKYRDDDKRQQMGY